MRDSKPPDLGSIPSGCAKIEKPFILSILTDTLTDPYGRPFGPSIWIYKELSKTTCKMLFHKDFHGEFEVVNKIDEKDNTNRHWPKDDYWTHQFDPDDPWDPTEECWRFKTLKELLDSPKLFELCL